MSERLQKFNNISIPSNFNIKLNEKYKEILQRCDQIDKTTGVYESLSKKYHLSQVEYKNMIKDIIALSLYVNWTDNETQKLLRMREVQRAAKHILPYITPDSEGLINEIMNEALLIESSINLGANYSKNNGRRSGQILTP